MIYDIVCALSSLVHFCKHLTHLGGNVLSISFRLHCLRSCNWYYYISSITPSMDPKAACSCWATPVFLLGSSCDGLTLSLELPTNISSGLLCGQPRLSLSFDLGFSFSSFDGLLSCESQKIVGGSTDFESNQSIDDCMLGYLGRRKLLKY